MGVTWGYGEAPLVKPATKEETELVVIGSDFHFPYQNEDLVSSFVRFVKKVKPHTVVLNGDINDFFQLSRFNTGLHRIDDLQAEIDEGNVLRGGVRKALPNARIIETEGNHDNRIHSYVEKNARALVSLRALEPAALFEYKTHGIDWYPGAGVRLRPHFIVKHGSIVRGEVGATAKAELAHAGISGVSGHTHRFGPYRKESYNSLQWNEGGCFCRLDPDYVVGRPNWTNGCTLVHLSTKTDSFLIEEVQAVNNKLVYGGVAY